MAFATAVLIVWVGFRRVMLPTGWAGAAGRVPVPVGLAVRAGWLGAASLGLAALVGEINSLV